MPVTPRFPDAPAQYDQRDQNELRRMLELALGNDPAGGRVSGTSGKQNYLLKWQKKGAATFADSTIQDDGTTVTVGGDLAVSGGDVSLGATQSFVTFTNPYHLLYGGHSTTPCRIYIGANTDPSIYLDATNYVYMRDLSSNTRFQFNVAGTPWMAIGGSQVLTTRRTGWALPTGTLSRATFDQSTVTLAQLAQRVAALITDLYSGHGLIGA